MRILAFQFPLEPAWGGAETHSETLLGSLSNLGNEVFLVSSNKNLVAAVKKIGLRAWFLWAGWEPTSAKALVLFPITLLAGFVVFLHKILTLRPDWIVCLSLTDKLIASPLARLLGIRVLWIEHTRIGRWLTGNPLLFWYRLASNSVRIAAPSFFLRNQLAGLGIPIKRLSIVYPGIAITQPLPGPTGAKQKFVIGFLGRLTKEKGVETLLQACAQLLPGISVKIAGAGPEENSLKNKARALNISDRVEFVGFIKNASEFLVSIDALIVPSVLPESFGLAAVEAMAAGTVVIASRVGALPEIIEDGKTGFLFNPGDSGELAGIIERCRTTDTTKLVAAARAAVATRFAAERMVDEFSKIFGSSTTA